MRRADPERKRKRRKRFRVIMEIAFMVLSILCSVMPYPFPLVVPIGIGTIRIISNAVRKEKEPPTTQPIVYCNGEREPKRRRVNNADAVTVPPRNGKTDLQVKAEVKKRSSK